MKDCWIRQTVKHGYKIRFQKKSPNIFVRTHYPQDQKKQQCLQEYLVELFRKKAIMSLPQECQGKGVYSLIFLVPKASGKLRLVFDLRSLNLFIIPKRFRMESIYTITSVVQLGDWLILIDLTDAKHVPIYKHHQKYLRFTIEERHYQFKCLPLASTPLPGFSPRFCCRL